MQNRRVYNVFRQVVVSMRVRGAGSSGGGSGAGVFAKRRGGGRSGDSESKTRS